jgi:hypothetical protein
MIIKKSIERKLPVYLIDSSGVPITGVAWDDVTPPTVKYQKEGASGLTSKTLSASNWIEIGQGSYEVVFTSTELNTKGKFTYFATADGALQYPGLVQIANKDIEAFDTEVWASTVRTLTAGTKDTEIDQILDLVTDIFNGGNDVYQSFTYDVNGRVDVVTLKYGSDVAPVRTRTFTFTYDSEGKVLTFDEVEI